MRNGTTSRGYAELFYAAALCSSTLFFFAPLVVYYHNAEFFSFVAPSILPYLVAVSLACTCLLALYPLILPAALRQRAVSLLIAFSFLLWVQGNILLWRYGSLDGTPIPWETLHSMAVRDGILWGAVCAAALFGYRFVFRFARRLIAVIFTIQVLGLVSIILQAPEEAGFKRYRVDEAQTFNFSPEKNVIIVLVDSFQGNVFDYIVRGDQSLQRVFDGFTLFRNAVGGYSSTFGAVPLLLTGQYLDPTIPFQEFILKAYSHSLPSVLKRSGYQFHIQESSMHGGRLIDVNLASNVTPRSRTESITVHSLARLYDVALLRYLPYFAKKYVWCGTMGILEQRADTCARAHTDPGEEDPRTPSEVNMEFLANLASDIKTQASSPTFKYFYLWGLHPPFMLNEKCMYEPMPYTPASYERQAKGMLCILGRLFDVLKQHDVYDRSLIIICGDHGRGYSYPLSPEMRERCARPGGAEAEGMARRSRGVVSAYTMARGWPLLLVKPPRSAGSMRINDAPVCQGDIPATIVSELGLAAEFPGRSIFAMAESETRVRRYYQRVPESRWENGFAFALREYTVNGFVWCPDSWSATGYLLSPGTGRIPDNGGAAVTAP